MSISPKSTISATSPLTLRTASTEFNLTRSPFFNFTVGPSMESTGTTQPAFPGSSVFICVPAAVNPSKDIVSGFNPTAASPELRARPYRSRKEPFADGRPNTGLPAIKSARKSFFLFAPFDFTSFVSHSQPSSSSRSTCRFIFGAFIAIPSVRTSTIPPLILSVATLSRSL
ncbi:hypothetical protein ES705_38972 [subsurface metagenome]